MQPSPIAETVRGEAFPKVLVPMFWSVMPPD